MMTWHGSNTLAVRQAIFDHRRGGGPRGLFSVPGVKCTTARRRSWALGTGHWALGTGHCNSGSMLERLDGTSVVIPTYLIATGKEKTTK